MRNKIGNSEVTPQALWPVVKSLWSGMDQRHQALHEPWEIKSPERESQHDAGYLENQFTSHDLCDENHEGQLETRVQVLLAFVDNTPLGKVRPCDTYKLANSLKLRNAREFDNVTNKHLRHLPKRPLVYLTHLFHHYLRLSHFPKPWKEKNVITLPKPGKDPKLSQNLYPISFLSTTGIKFKKIILKII
jgi:hypothetical protein